MKTNGDLAATSVSMRAVEGDIQISFRKAPGTPFLTAFSRASVPFFVAPLIQPSALPRASAASAAASRRSTRSSLEDAPRPVKCDRRLQQ